MVDRLLDVMHFVMGIYTVAFLMAGIVALAECKTAEGMAMLTIGPVVYGLTWVVYWIAAGDTVDLHSDLWVVFAFVYIGSMVLLALKLRKKNGEKFTA
jgi:hypothetical protein